MAYPYEHFKSNEDDQTPVDILNKQKFCGKIKNECPGDKEIERTKEIIRKFKMKNGEEFTRLYLKSDVIFLTCVFETFIKVSIQKFGPNPLYCVSLPGYTWQCGLKNTD